ncbi:MAG: penicillin-binding transpeptidase domain-containing protein [Prosthecobacter sp.]
MNAEVSMMDVLSHTALKGAAVLAVALMAGVLLHRVAAARRYAVWITTVAALAFLPPAMLLLPAWRVLPQTHKAVMEWPERQPEEVIESQEPVYLSTGTKMTFSGASFEAPKAALAAIAPAPAKRLSWQDIAGTLPFVWLAISTLLLLRLAWGAARLSRLEKTLSPGACDQLAEVTREVGLSRPPRLLIGTENAVPMVWGVWRPRLLLPLGFESWSPEKLRGVLLHELAHLKRRDPLALWTAQWVKALHWFNPLAWLTIRQLRADQERACDDTVLRHGVRPSDYAQHLLDLSRHARLAPGLALCALTITRCAPVESRVKAILDPKRSREGLTLRWLLGMGGLALLTTLPVAMLHAIEGPKLRGRMLDRNGLVLAESTPKETRRYPLKALTGHLTGYTRLQEKGNPQIFGGAAMEKKHDAALREGTDVALSIDSRIQALVLRTMQDAGYKRGAVVVLDPRTGEILASVSLPVYDPNILIPSISQKDWDALLKNKDVPLLNRCVRAFVPGSAFTPLTALAGTMAGVSNGSFTCNGSVTYGSRELVCWKRVRDQTGHGTLDMKGAIVTSCNCYWYQFGNAAGTEAFEKVGSLLGFGQGYALLEDEDKGILSTPGWLTRVRPQETWTPGHTANMAIGQGMMLATPLQMAVLAATVAQRGQVPQPTFLRLQKGQKAQPRADLIAEGVDAGEIELIRDGMRLVVNGSDGTGKNARSDKVVISGKTGVAQNWRRVGGMKVEDNHGWFIGFAPYDHPTLAFAILKSGAKSGGGDCAPLAKRIVEEALALPADGSGVVAPVALPPPDVEGAEIKEEIGLEAAAVGPNFKLHEPDVADGKITVTGEAASVNQVFSFFNRLRALGKRRNILQWEIPAPAVQDDNTAIFRAIGTYLTQPAPQKATPVEKPKDTREEAAKLLRQLKETQAKIQELEKQLKTAPSAALEQQRQALLQESTALYPKLAAALPKTEAKKILVSKMQLEERERWRAMREAEGLAEMPENASIFVTTSMLDITFSPQTDFRFSLSREAAHRWVVASLSQQALETYKAELQWPAKGEVFLRVYHTPKGGSIQVRSQGGDNVEVSILKARPLIAPDYAPPTFPDTAGLDAPPPPKASAQATGIAGMRPADVDRWKGLQVQGLLAAFPGNAVVRPMSERDKQHTYGWFWFEFSTTRQAAHRWLLDSLTDQMRKEQAVLLQWPDPSQPFRRNYEAANDCHITVHRGDVDIIYVTISKKRPRIMIAPDEATPPRPKTAAPRELEGVANVSRSLPNPS